MFELIIILIILWVIVIFINLLGQIIYPKNKKDFFRSIILLLFIIIMNHAVHSIIIVYNFHSLENKCTLTNYNIITNNYKFSCVSLYSKKEIMFPIPTDIYSLFIPYHFY